MTAGSSHSRAAIALVATLLVCAGCHEFPCEEPLQLEPESVPIAGDVRFTYFTTRGVETTRDPDTIPPRSRPSVLIQEPDQNLPIGIVLAADISDGVPADATPTTHGFAARRAYTGLMGGWMADRVWGRSQTITDDIRKATPSSAAEESTEGPFADFDLGELERKRRDRWSNALQPRLVDVGLNKAPRDVWVFDREGCYAEVIDPEARRFDVERLEDAQALLRKLSEWAGHEPSVPATWRPEF